MPLHVSRASWEFLRRWPVIPAIVLVAVISTAFFGDNLAPHDPRDQNLRTRFIPPFWVDEGSFDHVLGTDHLGRDIFSRLLVGSRTSLMVAGIALGFGLLAGNRLRHRRGVLRRHDRRDNHASRRPVAGTALPPACAGGRRDHRRRNAHGHLAPRPVFLVRRSPERERRGAVPEGEGLRGAGQGGRGFRLADNPPASVAAGDSRGAGDHQHACGRTDYS